MTSHLTERAEAVWRWILGTILIILAIASLAYAHWAKTQKEPVLGFGLEVQVTQGHLNSQELRATVVDEAASLRYCYQEDLIYIPWLAGTAEFDLTIGSNVFTVEHASDNLNVLVDTCLKQRLQQMNPNRPTGEDVATARVILTFGPQFTQPVREPRENRKAPPPSPAPGPLNPFADSEDKDD